MDTALRTVAGWKGLTIQARAPAAWPAAFLASRGYVVLQPNYRGSGGYGDAWQRAGYRQWGGLMQRDLDDGVDALVRSGIADASRVCVVGAEVSTKLVEFVSGVPLSSMAAPPFEDR